MKEFTTEEKNDILRELVRCMKKDKQIKYTEVAKYSGLSSSMISLWMSNKKELTEETVEILGSSLMAHRIIKQTSHLKVELSHLNRQKKNIEDKIEELEKKIYLLETQGCIDEDDAATT